MKEMESMTTDLSKLTDEELMRIVQLADDADACPREWEELDRRFWKRVWSLVNRMIRYKRQGEGNDCHEIASDLTQETFVKVFKHCRRYDEEKGTVSQWIFTIARNLALSYLKDKGKKGDAETLSIDAPSSKDHEITRGDLIPSATPSPEELAWVLRCLDSLPLKDRNVLVHAEVYGYTVREIGKLLGVSHATAHRLWLAAKANFKRCYGERK